MKVLKTVEEFRTFQKENKKSIGFIPTMGALHEGHGSLFVKSISENELTVVSVFINPTQFNNKNDLEEYPVQVKKDLEFCEELGVDIVFLPERSDVYFEDESLKIKETDISSKFEGEFRPGHFSGVLIVVLKLLQIVKPMRAYFGKKDYQQYLLIKQMVRIFFIEVEVKGVEIYRDKQGLPFSSRNLKLSLEDLKKAQVISKKFLETNSKQEFIDSVKVNLDYYGILNERILMAHQIAGVRILENKEVLR